MVSLKTVGDKFKHDFTVIEGGAGTVRGVLSQPEQESQPSYVFVQPRHVLRTSWPTALKPGMVLRSSTGGIFLVGDNGPAENHRGILWESFRLFQATGQYVWQRRTKLLEPISKQYKEGPLQNLGTVWAALEPLERESLDREMRISFEQRRVIAGAPLQPEDILDNHAVTKVDKQLGLSIGTLT